MLSRWHRAPGRRGPFVHDGDIDAATSGPGGGGIGGSGSSTGGSGGSVAANGQVGDPCSCGNDPLSACMAQGTTGCDPSLTCVGGGDNGSMPGAVCSKSCTQGGTGCRSGFNCADDIVSETDLGKWCLE